MAARDGLDIRRSRPRRPIVPVRIFALVLAALLLPLGAARPAAAHGEAPDRIYDALLHSITFWLGPQGETLPEAPADSFVAFAPGAPGQPGKALAWDASVPIAATVLGGLGARLLFKSDGAVFGRAPDNALLQVEAALSGQPVAGSATLVTAPETPLKPNTPYALDVRTASVPLNPLAGDKLGLRVSLLGVAVTGAPGIVLGPSGSRANYTARAHDLDDLGHQHPGWIHVRYDDFGPLQVTTSPVFDIEVHHGDPDTTTQSAKVGSTITLRLINGETPEQGATHGPWGLDSPHRLRLAGLGLDEALSIYPAEVLMRTLRLEQVGTLVVSCEANCQRQGSFAALQVTGGSASAQAPAEEQRVRVDPGKFFEVNLQLAQDEVVTWSFRSDPARPIKWDIHSHAGTRVVVHATGENASASGTFRAPAPGIYSLFMENSNPDPVQLTYTVQGGSPYVPPPKSALPLPVWLLAPALLAALALAGRRPKRPAWKTFEKCQNR